MSGFVELTLRAPLAHAVEAECVAPQRFAELGERDIAALPVWVARRRAQLGDFFHVRGQRSAQVRVIGATALLDSLGAGTTGGELLIDGDAGHRTGAGMSGGHIEVHGRVGDDAGLAMSGGVLRVAGDVGDRTGANLPGSARGMSGGELVVGGSCGRDTGARMRRGLVVVCGAAGARTGRAVIAGSVIVFGDTGPRAGVLSKRGSIVALGAIDVPATYRYACTYHPPHVRLTLVHLRRTYGVSIPDRAVGGLYRRYVGDAGEPGKGEILELGQ